MNEKKCIYTDCNNTIENRVHDICNECMLEMDNRYKREQAYIETLYSTKE